MSLDEAAAGYAKDVGHLKGGPAYRSARLLESVAFHGCDFTGVISVLAGLARKAYPSMCPGGSMKSAIKVFAFMLLVSQGSVGKSNAQTSEMQVDRARRDMKIRWPAAYDPSVAPVFSHNELLIHADCHRVFARLSDATAWPGWLVIVKDVSSETPKKTGRGALYRLKIFNSPIQSRIVEFEADQRISWIPFGADETETRHGHYHAWRLVPQAENCLVITEETGIGAGDRKDPAAGSHLMHKAHELWLDSLRYISEP